MSRHTTATSCATWFSCLWSHIYSLVNIPHFFKNNFWPALVRLFNILLTFVFTWFLWKRRDVQGFLMNTASLTVFPDSCLINGSNSIPDLSFFPRTIFHSSPTHTPTYSVYESILVTVDRTDMYACYRVNLPSRRFCGWGLGRKDRVVHSLPCNTCQSLCRG